MLHGITRYRPIEIPRGVSDVSSVLPLLFYIILECTGSDTIRPLLHMSSVKNSCQMLYALVMRLFHDTYRPLYADLVQF